MDRMVAGVIEAICRKVVESFSSKVVEQTVDDALNSVNNARDFERIFKNLRKNLKSLSAKAADVEEELMNRELSGQKKRKREVEEWLEEVESIKEKVVELGSQIDTEGFVMRLIDGGKAEQLDKQVEELVDQSRNFGELVLDVCRTSSATFLTEGLVGQAISKNLETILRLLESRQVSSIGVHGMGGVGKTTLAQHIYNRLMQQSGGCVFWVTVSREFTVRGLQDKISRLLGVQLSDEDETGMRAMRLHTTLSEKKNSVLILDDVWEHIDMKKVGCLSSTDGCRLIITTRSLEVCRRIGCRKEIPVEKLDEGAAWDLFNERLGNEEELDPEVERIAKSMIKLCGGLPLAIITVAGSMKGKRDSHRWRNAFDELHERVKGQDGMGEDEVFEVLKFSFDGLKKRNDKSNEFNTKQLCFLYCSLYPEDYRIGRNDLARNFISEGLLDERKSRRARVDQGHSILDELVDVCLLETVDDYLPHKCVKMHDLVRSMALKICEGKYMVRAGERSLKEIPYNEKEWTKDLEKASFMNCNIQRIGEGISPDCPKLSTLLLCENSQLKVIPESFFSKMQGLCTLNLRGTNLRVLPKSVSDLTSLKALLLEYCRQLETVPYLGKLKELRELNLSGTDIKEVPEGLEELFNLRFLSIDAPNLKMLPRGVLLKLGHLQHLNLPPYIHSEEFKNLKQLEEFNGGVNNVSDFNCFITTRVCDPCYRIAVMNSTRAHTFRFGGYFGYDEKRLFLCGCNLKDEKVLAKGVMDLTIIDCEGLSTCFADDLPRRFDNPTSLRALTLSSCGEIECILRNDGQGSQFSNTLKAISLYSLDGLKRVVMEREEIGASIAPTRPPMFSSLRSLDMMYCNKVRKLGFAVTGLSNLERIKIWSCKEIEEIFEEDERRDASNFTILPKFKSLTLEELPRLRKVGLHIQKIPNLESIAIGGCCLIEEILEEDEGKAASIITTLPELKELSLRKLPRLRKVGLHIKKSPKLESICIQDCGEIEEIFEDEGRDPLTTLSKLENLRLEGLPRLKSVSKATIISNSIETIWIRKCPNLMRKLPLHMDVASPPFRVKINVEREWWESLQWDSNPNLPQLLLPLVRFQGS